jgi:AcrR family transcriptional regulator
VDTKERLLDSAEELFAERGFDGTSLRGITNAAGANLGAVNYHFGSKEELLQAVLARRFEPINRRRLELLDDLEAGAGAAAPSMEALLRAFLEPPFREIRALGEAGARFVRLAGRAHQEPNPRVRALFLRMFQEVMARYIAAFRKAAPELSDEELHWKIHFLVGAMAHTLSWGPHEECATLLGAAPIGSPDEALEELIAFCTAGINARVPQGAVEGGRS